jgi:MFS family permease
LILGWGSAVYIFKEEGFFSSECTESYQRSILNGTCAESCVSQDAHFNVSKSIFENILLLSKSILVAAVASYEIGGAFFGWIFDQYGTGKTRIAVNVSQTVGILCLAFATQDTSWLLYLGAIIIGMSGIMVLVLVLQSLRLI